MMANALEIDQDGVLFLSQTSATGNKLLASNDP
jgi:hypothetical protein